MLKFIDAYAMHDSISIDLLAGTEQFLKWRNSTTPGEHTAECLHVLIERVAALQPEAEAICAWDGSMSYRELNELSDVVSRQLQQIGLGVGNYIPFAFEKSKWVVVACIGILKAGAAFVPLNVTDPDSRIEKIIKDVNCKLCLTSFGLASRFQSIVPTLAVGYFDAAAAACDLQFGDQLVASGLSNSDVSQDSTGWRRSVEPSDVAFVLFTSGSTGQPKGIIHDHQSISTQWLAQGKRMNYQNARVLQFAAHTFDVFIIDVFTALLFGGCVCIPSEVDRQNNIVEVINTMRVDHAILMPSFLGLLDPSDVPTLKILAVGGEALPQDRVERWADKVQLIQIYGPAEAGICLVMDMKTDTRPESVGFPLSNASCWLVDADDHDRLVPIGAVGELLVAGPSLAKGYLNNPAKTQSAFIEPPIWARNLKLPFAKYHKTGDLLRFNVNKMDGSYDFVGRKDSQIKLRGQRIDPGEVEFYVGQLPEIRNVTVLKPECGAYAEQLVAVVDTKSRASPALNGDKASLGMLEHCTLNTAAIQEFLSRHLSTYMLPNVYLEVADFPHTASMKIDRNKVLSWLNNLTDCPTPESRHHKDLDGGEVTARHLSRELCEILRRKNESHNDKELEDHDFVLQHTGVDSIQIISFAMFIRKTYGVSLMAATLLDPDMTIRRLAKMIESYESSEQHDNDTGSFKRPEEIVAEMSSLQSTLESSLQNPITASNIQFDLQGPVHVLLTGASGYLGSVILLHLLKEHVSVIVYALVRCTSQEEGLRRVVDASSQHGTWDPSYTSRIRILIGDLDQPDLGISPENLDLLKGHKNGDKVKLTDPDHVSVNGNIQPQSIHAIVHAGATVHYSRSYASLKQTNVLSTLTLLSLFANNPQINRFMFISGGENPSNTETISNSSAYLNDLTHNVSGYTQSKVIAQSLVHYLANPPNSTATGKHVSIIKPGHIIGTRETGVANRNDFIWRLIAGCIEIGVYNAGELGGWIYVADVSTLALQTVHTLFPATDQATSDGAEKTDAGPSNNRVVHRALQGIRFDEIWEIMRQDFGYQIEATETSVWKDKLVRRVVDAGDGHVLWPLLDTIQGGEGGTISVDAESGTRLEDGAEQVRLAVKRNVEFLIGIGFLPASPVSKKNGIALRTFDT